MRTQVIFSSVLLVRRNSVRRKALTLYINNWLQSCCQQHEFGFHDHENLFRDQHLLRRDGIHVTKQGEGVFASKTDLGRRALT